MLRLIGEVHSAHLKVVYPEISVMFFHHFFLYAVNVLHFTITVTNKLLPENRIDLPFTVICHDTALIKIHDLMRFSKFYDLFWCLRNILQHRWRWTQFYWISSLIWVLCMYSLSKAESLLQLIIILNTAPGHTAKPAINYHKLSLGLHASGSCIVSKVVRWR